MPGTQWSYPLIARGSKLGIHSILPNKVGQFAETLANGGAAFPLVKAVDDLGWLSSIKQTSPQTITIARLTSSHEGCEGVESPDADLDEMADRLMGVILDKLAGSPDLREAADYWEVANEPDPAGAEGYRRLSLLMIKCMERAEAEGLKLALFSFNTGTPEWEEMKAMVATGVFARARQGGHILALHEGVPWPDRPIDLWWGDPIPGSPEVAGAGPLCFRYRYLYHLLRQRGEVVPLVVSEWYGGRYAQHGAKPEDIVEQVRWYDEKAREDYWMWAFCPFTLGPVGGWSRQDYEFAYTALVEYMLSVKDAPNAQPTAEAGDGPEPGEKPCRGTPRAQYRRVYVLLPPDADSTWAQAVVDATWDDRRFTVGGSADDAGIGDLDERTVVAVNPSRWPEDLEEFFRTHYPGVRYVPVEASTPSRLAQELRSIEV